MPVDANGRVMHFGKEDVRPDGTVSPDFALRLAADRRNDYVGVVRRTAGSLTHDDNVEEYFGTDQDVTLVWDGTNFAVTLTSGVMTLSTLTASRLMQSDASKGLSSVADLTSWVASDNASLTVTDDGDGSLTLGLDADLDSIAALSDPNADRVLFWDDSAGAYDWLTMGAGLGITLTTLDVDHDAANNFVANEHIDHTSVTLTAGVGLSGGGDISTSRSFAVDLDELTTETSIASGDFLAMVDITDSGSGKITFANLEGTIDHGSVAGLGDDDHTQYALLAGRSGGQTLIGGTASGEDLTLQSSSHATKGSILFGSSAYDEVNDRLGVGTASPQVSLHAMDRIRIDQNGTNYSTLLQEADAFHISRTGTGGNDISIQADGDCILGQQGNVGVGTAAPQTNAHIQESNTDTTPAVEIEQLSTGDAALQLSIVGDAVALGIDNTDDSFKMSYAAGAGTAVLGTGDFFTFDPSSTAKLELRNPSANDGDVRIVASQTDHAALELDTQSGATSGLFHMKYNGTTASAISLTSGETAWIMHARDLGNDITGPQLRINRNTNATNSSAGSIRLVDKSGTSYFVWVDDSGVLRINTSAPTGTTDTGGTVVGTQT